MVARANSCDPQRLRLLLDDRLPPAGQAELERHLGQCRRCQDTLDNMAGGGEWTGAVRRYLGENEAESEPPAREAALGFLAPSDRPGSLGRVGPYEVEGVLGRGGMGVVLRAFDEALGRPVAIKVLSAELATSGAARQRFAREARAAAAVAHEHVVTVHGVDAVAGLPYLVMEYVPGSSLQQRLDAGGPLGLREVLRIGLQAAAGLAAAHAQGLVHRDVKPANILLENGVERVKLTDFGLARAVDDASVTQSGVISGTPQYMAPEQARGDAVDHRADLFSLGSVLYAMCAGHAPFRAATTLAVLRRVCDEEPRPLRSVNPDVPAWLAAIVARLLAKDPEQRFASAAEVADLLGRCLAHVQQPDVVPLPAFAAPAGPRPVRSARAAVAGLAVVLLLGIGAVAWFGGGAPHSGGPSSGKPETADAPLRVPPWLLTEFDAALRQTDVWVQSVEASIHVPTATPRDRAAVEALDLLRRLDALKHELEPPRPTSGR